MGGVDEVKGLVQLAGGIIMGGLALYKLSNVEDGYETDESVTFSDKQQSVAHKKEKAVQSSSTTSTEFETPKVTHRRRSQNASGGSWKTVKSHNTPGDVLGDIELEGKDKETESADSTAASSMGIDDAGSSSEDEALTPSWLSQKDPQIGEKSGQYTPTKLKIKSGASLGEMVSGNETLSKLAYDLSDSVFVYPLTSESGNFFGSGCVHLGNEGAHNLQKHKVDVKVMETRAGAGSAVAGSLLGGSTSTILTNSETLKAMIPSMFEIAENRLPTVFHVAAHKIDQQSLQINADYSDVMLARDTGFVMLAAGTNQEIYDLGVVSHAASRACSLPVMHFFDGTRGLSEISQVKQANMEDVVSHLGTLNHGPMHTFGLEAAASDDRPFAATAIQQVMNDLKPALGSKASYKIIEYSGPKHPEAVIVATGSTATVVKEALESSNNHQVGVVNVRLLRPWSTSHFLEAVPKSTKKVCVLDQSGSLNPLFLDVASAIHSNIAQQIGFSPLLIGGRVLAQGLGFDSEMAHAVVANILSDRPQPNFTVTEENHTVAEGSSVYEDHITDILAWSTSSQSSRAMSEFALELGNSSGLKVQQNASQDPYDGFHRSELRIADKDSELSQACAVKYANVVVVSLSKSSTKNLDTAVCSVRKGGTIVLASDNLDNMSDDAQALIMRNRLKVYFVDVLSLEDGADTTPEDLEWLQVAAALQLSSGSSYQALFPYFRNGLRAAGKGHLSGPTEDIRKHIQKVNSIQFRVQTFADKVEDLADGISISSGSFSGVKRVVPRYSPRFQVASSADANIDGAEEKKEEEKIEDESRPAAVDAHQVAWSVMFKNAYETKTALRPAHHDVHFAKVTKIQRLTPDDYSRNIFHMEFDISNTPIKYEIGDALGVFGHNDQAQVDAFIAEYGLDPNQFVRLPRRGAMPKSEFRTELVSLRNLLTQHLDLFGRPSKKFYTGLAQFAKSRYEYLRLMHIGTDDTESFKLGIHETTTFAEILLQYRTARPSVEQMVAMIPEIKARHYSISSSMKVCPRSVHLLVVAVDWETPLGKRRCGQCTRYLKSLKPGQIVSVDIQKSVLRLPPNPTQPIVMAGLGTGMAPFRAFLQERLWQMESGIKVGPCVLYFGARHKKQEWLYGEELEKMEKKGLVRLGLAWSRDQKHKVYIQHKIKEDANILKEYLGEKKGYFYLCGPTWPVPDVRDAIASGLTPEKVSKDGEIDVEVVEDMKDEGRYILEVY